MLLLAFLQVSDSSSQVINIYRIIRKMLRGWMKALHHYQQKHGGDMDFKII